MRIVGKYEIPGDEGTVDVGAGFAPLSTGMQRGRVMVWGSIDIAGPPERRRFYVRGTGHEIGAACVFIGTVFDGPFVWHVFDGGPA